MLTNKSERGTGFGLIGPVEERGQIRNIVVRDWTNSFGSLANFKPQLFLRSAHPSFFVLFNRLSVV